VDGCISNAPPNCTERQWYHADALGSVLARTDSSGTAVAAFDYLPWGEQWTVPAAQGDRQYNGRVYDSGTSFHDYGARMYWPQLGRFISPDSYRGDPASPPSLNVYSYVNNGPYRYTDATGRCPMCIGAAVGAVAGGIGAGILSYNAGVRGADLVTDILYGVGIGGVVGSGVDALIGVATGAGAFGVGAAAAAATVSVEENALRSEGQALMRAEPVGKALKDDIFHRAASFMRETAARSGTVFQISGAQGAKSTLTQVSGDLNGQAGRYEYIVDALGQLTHQRFVPGGSINGVPIDP
jgi:RHS repeat-associated protein